MTKRQDPTMKLAQSMVDKIKKLAKDESEAIRALKIALTYFSVPGKDDQGQK
jgi:hypothetical protein